MRYFYVLFVVLLWQPSCRKTVNTIPTKGYTEDYSSLFLEPMLPAKSALADTYPFKSTPEEVVAFAKTLLGCRYQFCSMTPDGGFDCSGFINYVYNHFKVTVPRSSVEFTNIGKKIELNQSHPGDIILFTGTNSRRRVVGHIGMIVDNENGKINFIQATSGAEYCVTISPLNDSYRNRFMKVIRIIN